MFGTFAWVTFCFADGILLQVASLSKCPGSGIEEITTCEKLDVSVTC